jgi:hypothetical protein
VAGKLGSVRVGGHAVRVAEGKTEVSSPAAKRSQYPIEDII